MNIIYGVCSWGLGHATRSLPLIRALISEDHNLTIISSKSSLALLKNELGSDSVEYIDMEDYPIPVAENTRQLIGKTMVYWPIFIKRIEDGLRQLSRILEKRHYDCIISDGRYDIYSKKTPSYFISHQMRIMNPLRIKIFEKEMERFNLFFFFKRFKEVIVPDYRDDDLSGDLSHNLDLIDEDKLHYVGVLSDFKKKRMKKDIDYLFSISGPEPQRTILEKLLLKEIDKLDGNIVVTLGKPEWSKLETTQNHVVIYSSVDKRKREELLNRAKLIVSRSGYSTIMDLAVINVKALMIPTPGQIEQEYLAEYHNKKNTFYSVKQYELSLEHDIEKAKKTTGVKRRCDVDKTVKNILDIIHS
jgi:uncharacterized protein (TIGR00661 family)